MYLSTQQCHRDSMKVPPQDSGIPEFTAVSRGTDVTDCSGGEGNPMGVFLFEAVILCSYAVKPRPAW